MGAKKINFQVSWESTPSKRVLKKLGHNGQFVYPKDYEKFKEINGFAYRQQREFMEAKWHETYKQI